MLTRNYNIILLVACLITVAIVFPQLLFDCNSFMMNIEGDGLKNYFGIYYYLKFDNDFHFTGMNYPFGENISFIDGQPLLSIFFKGLTYLIPAFRNYGLAITNLAMYLGIVLGVFFQTKVLDELSIPKILSFIGAILIIFFAPQLLRLTAHYSLSYTFCFPFVWYYLILLDKQFNKTYILTICIAILLFGLLHLYLLIICSFFVLAFSFLKFCFNKNRLKWLILFCIVLFSVLGFSYIFNLIDGVTDRTKHPWGFFEAYTRWQMIFYPHPKLDVFANNQRELPGFGEGFAYIGLVPIFFCILTIVIFTYKFFKVKCLQLVKQNLKKQKVIFLIVAILFLLFSMCLPFRFGFEQWVRKLSFLQQFRSLGRFAWLFYFIISAYSFVGLYRFYRLFKIKKLSVFAYFFCGCLLMLWFTQVYYRATNLRNVMFAAKENYKNIFNEEYSVKIKALGIDKNNYQAILSLPFYHIGSEKFSIENGASLRSSVQMSMLTGLPIINCFLSRTSISQSLQTVSLVSDSLLPKPIVNNFSDEKSIILTVADTTALNSKELAIIDKAKFIGKTNTVKLYTVSKAMLQQTTKPNINNKQLDNCNYKFNFLPTQNWDSRALSLKAPIDTFISIKMEKFKISDTLELSFWAKLEDKNDALPILEYQLYNDKNELYFKEQLNYKLSTDLFNDYILIHKRFLINSKTDILKIVMINATKCTNLLIRNANFGVNSIDTVENQIFLNNKPVKY